MELGETVCLPNTAPRCDICPLQSECLAFRAHTVDQLPTRIKKTKRRVEKRNVLFVRTVTDPPRLLLHRRPNTGLLAGLWELPNTLSADPLDALEECLHDACTLVGELPESKHLFSHIEWSMSGYLYQTDIPSALPDGYALVTLDQLKSGYPLPSAFRTYANLSDTLLQKEN